MAVKKSMMILGVIAIFLLMSVSAMAVAVPDVCTITLTSPAGGESWKGTQTISWNAAESGNGCSQDKFDIYHNSAGSGFPTTTTGNIQNDFDDASDPREFSWNTSTVVDGTYMVKVCEKNTLPNCASTSSLIKIDSTAPTVVLSYDNSNSAFKSGTVVRITATFTDATSGIDQTNMPTISIATAGDGDVSATQMSRASNLTWFYDFTVPSGSDDDGSFTVTIAAQDAAGNQLSGTTTDSSKKVDNTAPTIILTGSSSVNVEAGSTYNDAGATATDNVDGTLTSSISTVNPVNTSRLGEYVVTYDVSDAAGNAATQVTRTVNVVDTTAPTSTLSAGDPSYESSDTLYVTSSTEFTLTVEDSVNSVELVTYKIDDGDEVNATDTNTFTLEGLSGAHTITHWSADTAGNVEETVEESVFVDDSAPLTSAEADEINGDNDWYVGFLEDDDPQIHLSCSDGEGSGTSSIEYWWDDEDSTTEEDSSVDVDIDISGTHSLLFFCVDNLGNEEDTQAIENIKYDDDTPTTQVATSPSEPNKNGWFISSVSVTLTCTDETSGCELNGEQETVFASLDGAEEIEVTEPITLEGDGEHTLEYWSQDVAGNSEETQTLTVKIDTTQATTDFAITPEESDGENNFYVSDATITLTCVDEESGCDTTVFYSWDDEDGEYTDGGSSVELSTEELSDGTHTLYYYAEDNAGNADATAAFVIKLDRNSPALGEDGVIATSSTTIDVQFSEDINEEHLAVSDFKVFRNGATSDVVLTELTGEIAIDSLYESDGIVTLTLGEELQDGDEPTVVINPSSEEARSIKDLAGNEYEALNDEQTVIDAIDPVVVIDHDIFLGDVDESITFIARASDVFSGVTSISWDFGDESVEITEDLESETSHSYSAEGAYTVTASTTDNERNSGSSTATAIIGSVPVVFDDAPDVSLTFTDISVDLFNISVEQTNTTNVSTSGFSVGGKFYDIQSDLVDGTFNITLTFNYDDADNNSIVDGTSINEGDLNVYFFNEVSSVWVAVANPVRDTAANTITVTVDHFTTFGLLTVPPAAPAASSSGGGGGGGGRTSRSVGSISPLPKKAAPQAEAVAPVATANIVPAATIPAQATPAVQNTPNPLSGQAVTNVGRSSKSIAIAVGAVVLIGGLGVWQFRKRRLK